MIPDSSALPRVILNEADDARYLEAMIDAPALRMSAGDHPARLNYGDCFADALAKQFKEPLLFKGNDFAQTDILPALKD